MTKRTSKYAAIRTEVNGIMFASKREAKRYSELCLLERAGEIASIELQPKFPCVVNGQKVCTYIADFAYLNSQGSRIVEDVKGFKTPMYRLKKKLVEALYPNVKIVEI